MYTIISHILAHKTGPFNLLLGHASPVLAEAVRLVRNGAHKTAYRDQVKLWEAERGWNDGDQHGTVK
ncbi:hypothetical protein BDR07DRAFT_1423845, partial [Suillus spraguei]